MTDDELSLRKGEIVLTRDEVAEMIALKEIFYKFIKKSIISLQVSLGTGGQVGTEQKAYSKIEGFQELIKDIGLMEKTLKEYKQMEQKKEQIEE